MKIQVYENRLIDFSEKEQGTQNENLIQTLTIEVPSSYDDYFKKIVFITEEGTYWDYIDENGNYIIPRNVTVFQKVDFYIWLTKEVDGENIDFRSKTYPLFFNENVSPDGEVPEAQETEMERVIRILEEEISKVEDLEDEVSQLKTDVETAIQQANNLDLDVNKVEKTATVTLTKKDGTVKTVQIFDGVSLQFMWDGTSLGIKTDDMQEYVFVDLQGVQGPVGPQGEAFQIKKTYSTIQAMVADYDNMQIGDYVMISGDIETQENATLWQKTETEDPTYKWHYLADFSGASGIQRSSWSYTKYSNWNSNKWRYIHSNKNWNE